MATKRRAARGGTVRPRRIPQRTCVACRQVEGKRQLVRIVRTPEGAVQLDPTGKRNGRGAYLHASRSCWDAALQRKALQHALKVEITDQDRAALLAYRESLPPDDPPGADSNAHTPTPNDESKVTEA